MKVLRASKALTGGDIFKAVLKLKPDARYPSVIAELSRMRSDKLIVAAGRVQPGGYDLWTLAPTPVPQAAGGA
jgi:hypothetical protein